MNDTLQSYAREHLARERPRLDGLVVQAFIASEEFANLRTQFNLRMLHSLGRFVQQLTATAAGVPPATASAPAPAPVLQKLPLPNLSPPPAAAEVQPPVPATEPSPPAAPAPVLIPEPPFVQNALPAPPDLPDAAFCLPNARAGSAYAQRLEPVDSTEPVVFVDIAIPDGLGLAAERESGAVTGTPPAAGEYRLAVTYHFARQSPSRRRLAMVPLVVAPDPRTMWQNRSTDPSAPYFKADEDRASVRGPDLSIVAASKRGRSHAHNGTFRDDDFRIAHLEQSGWYAAVVADGAGSARYSRRGAQMICEQACAHIQAALSGSTAALIDKCAQEYAQARQEAALAEQVDTLREELHTALSRIVGNAAYWAVKAIHDEVATRPDLGGAFKDYSSTALIGVCRRYPFGVLCAAYWVGDGAVGVYSRRDGITLLGEVDSGEYSGQTRFLDNTQVDHEVLRRRTRFALVDDMTAFVLMTDGVSDAKFETEARLTRAADWHDFWTELDGAVGFSGADGEQDRRLMDWLDFWSQGNHDDRTIAIIS